MFDCVIGDDSMSERFRLNLIVLYATARVVFRPTGAKAIVARGIEKLFNIFLLPSTYKQYLVNNMQMSMAASFLHKSLLPIRLLASLTARTTLNAETQGH